MVKIAVRQNQRVLAPQRGIDGDGDRFVPEREMYRNPECAALVLLVDDQLGQADTKNLTRNIARGQLCRLQHFPYGGLRYHQTIS